MKFIDDKKKQLKWYNRNYFFTGTIIFIAISILIFVIWGNISVNTNSWFNNSSFHKIIAGTFFGDFAHSNWEHILLNMVSLLPCAIYIERKYGTFAFLGLTLALSFVGSIMLVVLLNPTICWTGSSIIWFAMVGFVLVDWAISFIYNRNKTNIILGAVVLIIEYLRLCFFDKTGGGIGFGIKPVILLQDLHLQAFYGGLILGCLVGMIEVIIYFARKKKSTQKENSTTPKFLFVLLISVACVLGLSSVICSAMACTKTDIEIVLECENDEYDRVIKADMKDDGIDLAALLGYDTSKYIAQYSNNQDFSNSTVDNFLWFNLALYDTPTFSMDFIPLTMRRTQTIYLQIVPIN